MADSAVGERVNRVSEHGCFGCGELNSIGLKLKFYRDRDGGVRTRFVPRVEHEGYQHMTHGGIISTILDEAMSWAVVSSGRLAVTAKMEVRFRRPVVVEEPIEVTARVTRDRGRTIQTAAEMRDESGEVLASATGSFMRVSDDQQEAWRELYFGKDGESG
ncbi:MAG TPA: PaaI family thioesterase [Thermomicrobiaceae bacterium]|nr:PaaI family thioesterase [Thermomicrobiaceae bacterium]